MNRKILFVVLTLAVVILAAPFVGSVSAAGKGHTKQYYEFLLTGHYGPGPDTKSWTTEDGIMQVRNLLYIAESIEVTIGADTYYPDVNSYSCTMDFTLDTNENILYARIHETFELVPGGFITQHTAEMVTEYGTEFNGGGNFVGFGSGTLAGIKIQGYTSFNEQMAIDRIGTIMG